jgi:hypothetical protein
MTRQSEAGAIIAHYLRQLTQAAGRRWTEHNERDMQRLAELLADEQAETIVPFYPPAPQPAEPFYPPVPQPAELPAEPPRQIDSRVTQVLERERASADDLDDPQYTTWRQRRQRNETTIAQRILDREQR